jgi:hypothetical protein
MAIWQVIPSFPLMHTTMENFYGLLILHVRLGV